MRVTCDADTTRVCGAHARKRPPGRALVRVQRAEHAQIVTTNVPSSTTHT